MKPTAIVAIVGAVTGVVLAGLAVWWLTAPRGARPSPGSAATTLAGPPVPHVGITLFDPSPTEDTLAPVRREIPQSQNPVEHGRLVVEAAIERASSAVVGLWPPGTTLRTYFVTPAGEVIVDLTGVPASGLGGGTTAERLAVLALVSAVRANIPGAVSLRLLFDGQPAATPSLHLDLREPLAADPSALHQATGPMPSSR